MPRFTPAVLEAVAATVVAAMTRGRYIAVEPFLSFAAIDKMKKKELQARLRARGMDVSGTVNVLKGRLLARVQREKRGDAQPPTSNIFTWRKAQICAYLEERGCVVPSEMRRMHMLELAITTAEEAKEERNLRKRAKEEAEAAEAAEEKEDQGQSNKRRKTGEKSWVPVKVEVDLSVAASLLSMPITLPAKAAAKVVKTAYKGGKKAAKSVHRAGSAVNRRVQGIKKFRKEGGRAAYDKRVHAKAAQLQKVHKYYGKKKFLGMSFGPRGLSSRKAHRIARKDEDARLRRPESDPVIKGFFGRDAELERSLKEARWNAANVNNKTVATDVARAFIGIPSSDYFGRRVENPHSRPTRPSRRQVKFDL